MKQNAEGSASQLYTRISVLEREIEDLRAQNESLNKALKKAVSDPNVFSKEQSVHSAETRTSEADLQTIEQRRRATARARALRAKAKAERPARSRRSAAD